MHPQAKLLMDMLHQHKTLNQAQATRWFKTAPGMYSAHDQFLGVTTKTIRGIARHQIFKPDYISDLLHQPYNEARLLALIIMVNQYRHDDERCDEVLSSFLGHESRINNWNLVDVCAHHILGHALWQCQDIQPLLQRIHSQNLWQRRIALVASWYFIQQNSLTLTLELSTACLADREDLIHKAAGWMLRECGKKNMKTLCDYLDQYGHVMPRTQLRYAIEHLPNSQRQHYLALK